jgi:hypothetical protein
VQKVRVRSFYRHGTDILAGVVVGEVGGREEDSDDDNKPVLSTRAGRVKMYSHQSRMFSHAPVTEESGHLFPIPFEFYPIFLVRIAREVQLLAEIQSDFRSADATLDTKESHARTVI